MAAKKHVGSRQSRSVMRLRILEALLLFLVLGALHGLCPSRERFSLFGARNTESPNQIPRWSSISQPAITEGLVRTEPHCPTVSSRFRLAPSAQPSRVLSVLRGGVQSLESRLGFQLRKASRGTRA